MYGLCVRSLKIHLPFYIFIYISLAFYILTHTLFDIKILLFYKYTLKLYSSIKIFQFTYLSISSVEML